MGNIQFRVLDNVKCVHFKGVGDISFEFLISRIKEVHSDPDFDFTYNTFIDFENATVSFDDAGLETYQSFFEGLQKAKIHRKWAIYSKIDLTTISANMSHILLTKEIKVDVFEVRKQALDFLGISEENLTV